MGRLAAPYRPFEVASGVGVRAGRDCSVNEGCLLARYLAVSVKPFERPNSRTRRSVRFSESCNLKRGGASRDSTK